MLPVELVPVAQAWQTATDGSSVNYLQAQTTAISAIQFLSNAAPPCVPSITVEFTTGSQPTTSDCSLGICEDPYGASYGFSFSRGSGETNGALYIFKATADFASATILASLGTPNVTNTNGVKYVITPTAAVSGSNVVLSVTVQRLSDNNWLTSSDTWSPTKQNALTATNSSSPYPAQGGFILTVNQSVADIAIYGATMQKAVATTDDVCWRRKPSHPVWRNL